MLNRFNFRPLGLFFFSGLVVFWCRQYANLRLQMTPLVEDKLRNLGHRALQMRNDKPGLFCALISGFLIVLAVIGHMVSGAYIVVALLVLSIVISTKYDIKIVADRSQSKYPFTPCLNKKNRVRYCCCDGSIFVFLFSRPSCRIWFDFNFHKFTVGVACLQPADRPTTTDYWSLCLV